ncbi:hypothetical protein LSO9J_60014 [Candidatus Liberibacter solanacearum]
MQKNICTVKDHFASNLRFIGYIDYFYNYGNAILIADFF